jgi:hypothetical protein
VVACVALAGCGGTDQGGVTLPKGDGTAKEAAFTYRGATSQRQRLTIAVDAKLLAKFRIRLPCKDGGRTVAAIATSPKRPTLQPDGSFYYAETGRAEFSGFGVGGYRVAVSGQLQGATGAGHASFRISFKSTTCRAAVSWQARRA